MEENIPVRERDNIDFSVKKVTPWGILSCVMIWLEVASFTAGVVISYKENGDAGPLLGIVGVLIVIFSAAGANFGYQGLKRKGPEPKLRPFRLLCGVGKGTRTLDTRNHNPVL